MTEPLMMEGVVERLEEVVNGIKSMYQNKKPDSEKFEHLLTTLNSIVTHPTHSQDETVWSMLKGNDSVHGIRGIMTSYISMPTVQKLGLRLLGNMCTVKGGLDLMIADDAYVHVINTLQQTHYINNPEVMAEGFRVLGLLAMYSTGQRTLIRKDKCKWCNHVTMTLSEMRSNEDLVENGVMSLCYFFLDSGTEADYILLKGRLQLFLELLNEHEKSQGVQCYIMKLFSVLTTEQTVNLFIENGIHWHAMRNIESSPNNLELVKECICLFKKLSYNQLRLLRHGELAGDGSFSTNFNQLKESNICAEVKKLVTQHSSDEAIVICSLYIMDYLDEFKECSDDDAHHWSQFMFGVLAENLGVDEKIHLIEAACNCLYNLHEVRDEVPVTMTECLTLIHTINLHNEDPDVFIGSCGALAEIIELDNSFSLTSLEKGINATILEVMKSNPSSDNIQYVGCLFFINFQLQLNVELRLNPNFDPRGTLTELSALFCSHQHDIVVKELCMGALTLLLLNRAVITMLREQPHIYNRILESAKYYILISYLNQITLMFITLLTKDRVIAHNLLYSVNKKREEFSTLSLVINLTRRHQTNRECLLAGLYTLGGLMNCDIDPSVEVEGVTGAIHLLHELTLLHSNDTEIMKHILVTVRSFCILSSSVKLQLVECFVPTTLSLFKRSTDTKLNYIIYTFWSALGKSTDAKDTTVLSAALQKAIRLGDAISVQIFLEMNADVNAPYSDQYPIMAAIESKNPSIVEHVLWQNVEQRQVKQALDYVTASYSSGDVEILGFLLREFGFRAQDHTIDWCNLDLTALDPHWFFIIMDRHHVHYSNPVRHGRKISVASKAADVKQQLLSFRGQQPSLLHLEFQGWREQSKSANTVIREEEEEEEEEEEIGVGSTSTQLHSKSGFLDKLHGQLSSQYLEEITEVSYRECNALKDLHSVGKSSMRRRGSNTLGSGNPGNTLKHINISNNRITSLDKLGCCEPVMARLGLVTKLNLNHNQLQSIPASFGQFMTSVTDLDLSYNRFKTLPVCVLQMPLVNLNLSDNEIAVDCMNDAFPTASCPTLKSLDLSNNSYVTLPAWLQCSTPNLEILNFSSNTVKQLPETSLGLKQLKMLNLSKNQIIKIPSPFFKESDNLLNLDLSNNLIMSLSPTLHLETPNLKILELNHNRLNEDEIMVIRHLPCLSRLNLSNNMISGRFPPSGPGLSFFASSHLTDLDISRNPGITSLVIGNDTDLPLETLLLSETKVAILEPQIGNLAKLSELDISHTAISNLPLQIGNLTNLQQLKLSGLKDMDIPLSIKKSNNIVVFLRQKLMNSKPHYRIKLFVVGLEERGKTSLCSAIIKKQRDGTPLATVGVVKTDWYYKGNTENLITIWDFAGQKQFYVTHQCFLTQRGVYLVVFSLKKGAEEIDRIKPWLYTIQSRSPNAHVIIVGTHVDCATEEVLQSVNAALQELNQLDILDYLPTIEGVVFVNALQNNSSSLTQLRQKIISVAERAEAAPADSRNKLNKRVKIMGEKVPACFLELESFVSDCLLLPHNKYHPFPILEHDELVKQLKEKEIDIRDEDLENAVTFLHECGVMLHYNSYTQGLRQLYFIKPEWLSGIFAKIITIPEVHNWVKDGILKKKDMKILLGDEINKSDLIEKLISIMERFEIVLNITEDEILIPSHLPEARPPELSCPRNNEASLERLYRMPYIPHGFWPRLLTRLALFAPARDIAGRQMKRVMWCTGIYLQSDTTDDNAPYFLVEESDHKVVRIETTMCFQGSLLLGRIVYHIDTLVKEWYQGLIGKDIHGKPKVEYLVPCKLCRSVGLSDPNFTLQDLVSEGEVGDVATCSNNHTVDIASVAPDVMLMDFGDKLIKESDMDINISSSLGKGTQGSVCVGTAGGARVAVKMFGGSTKEQDYEEHPHNELRQEASILRLLNHPSVVKFVGVVHRPRCIILELAEYGSLDALIKNSPLSRIFTHRVLIQVSEGLDYLHRQNVIFRDLKPQNILIVSKDMGVPMNAKLSDFGVSGLTTDEGLLSYAGTTGYMAPNITGKHIYDTSVDVFSFGILIRELLTGKRVLSELNFPNQIKGAFMDGRATLRQETGWIDLTQLLNECVNPNPEERPSALEITDILSRADTICLRSVHPTLTDSGSSLQECIVMDKGHDTELWAKVRMSESSLAKYGVSVISLRSLTVIRTIAVPEYEEFICICSFTGDTVFLGGSQGRIIVLDASTYSVEYETHIPAPREDLHNLNILSMVALTALDTPLLVMGLGNGQLYVFSEEDVREDRLNTCTKVVTVEKNKPVTKICTCGGHVLAALHQIIHVFNTEFDKIFVFDMQEQRTQNHITKMCVLGSNVWVALHNASVVQVCRLKKGSGGKIVSLEVNKRKSVDVKELIKELPLTSVDPGPSFSPFHPTVRCMNTSLASSESYNHDLRITCMVSGDNCVFLGLRSGILIQLDTSSYKIKFVCRRHRGPLRVIVPHGSHDVATFGDEVLDFRGNVIPGANACSWNIGEEVETLNRYLHARKSMVRL